MIRFILKYDLTLFNKCSHYEFKFDDYETCFKTYLNMCKDCNFSNISIVKQEFKLVSTEVVKC